ncbi:nucleoporin-interacting protein, partial [Paenibacillus sp. TAF58]
MRLNAICLALFAAAVIAGVTYISIVYASPFARTWDEVDFTLALHRYDLLAMQPHFPGYPYFILGGWFIDQWMNNPVKALSVFNTLAALSSALPMFLLANRLTGGGMKSLLLPALVLSSPYIWLMSSRPMSECAG